MLKRTAHVGRQCIFPLGTMAISANFKLFYDTIVILTILTRIDQEILAEYLQWKLIIKELVKSRI